MSSVTAILLREFRAFGRFLLVIAATLGGLAGLSVIIIAVGGFTYFVGGAIRGWILATPGAAALAVDAVAYGLTGLIGLAIIRLIAKLRSPK